MNSERKALIRYRYQKARETLQVAEELRAQNHLSHAVNRYYYAVFYAIQSLLAAISAESRKHSGVIACFNREFVKTGIFDKKYARIVQHLFEERSDADYEDFKVFQKAEVEDLSEEVKAFLPAVEKYLAAEGWMD